MTAIPFPAAARSRTDRAVVTGRILSGVAIFLLGLDTALKVLQLAPAVEGTVQLGYPARAVLVIGLVQLVCVVLYAVPRTAVLGAVLLTGYLGGAVATHVRLENPLFTHILSPTYIGTVVWVGIYLRDARVRAVLPVRHRPKP